MSQLKYNLNNLIEQHCSKQRLKYIYFWGNQPRTDGTIDKSCLSQWWQSPFTIDNVNYRTAEHYMMAQKALLFNDNDAFDKIVNATHPEQAKDLGRKVVGFDETVWQNHRFDIVVDANLAKFRQHEELSQYLLNTGNKVLVEASPNDNIWGVGLAEDDERILNPEQWLGLNLLGFALMTARDRLVS